MMYNYANDLQLHNFASNIRALRQRAGLTKTAMARILHTSVRTVSRLEKGEIPVRLSAEVLFHAGQYFDIPAHKLLAERL